ncbi:MAG: phospholipase D-like domain-containing protein [Desulfomonilaceae bacterium]
MHYTKFLTLLLATLFAVTGIEKCLSSDLALGNTPVQVYFSPNGGCTQAIVNEINNSKSEILVQAYSFTSTPIAKALLEAHKRGVKVEVILDKSQRKASSIHRLHSSPTIESLRLLMTPMQLPTTK